MTRPRVAAAPDRVFAILADYNQGHPSTLPKQFSNLMERLLDHDMATVFRVESGSLRNEADVTIETRTMIWPGFLGSVQGFVMDRLLSSILPGAAEYWGAPLQGLKRWGCVEHVEASLYQLTADGFTWATRLGTPGTWAPDGVSI